MASKSRPKKQIKKTDPDYNQLYWAMIWGVAALGLALIILQPLSIPIFLIGCCVSLASLILLILHWVFYKKKNHLISTVTGFIIILIISCGFIYKNVLLNDQREESKTNLKLDFKSGDGQNIFDTKFVLQNGSKNSIGKILLEYKFNCLRCGGVTVFSYKEIYNASELPKRVDGYLAAHQQTHVTYSLDEKAENIKDVKFSTTLPDLTIKPNEKYDFQLIPKFPVNNKTDLGCADLVLNISFELENQPEKIIKLEESRWVSIIQNKTVFWKNELNSFNLYPCCPELGKPRIETKLEILK